MAKLPTLPTTPTAPLPAIAHAPEAAGGAVALAEVRDAGETLAAVPILEGLLTVARDMQSKITAHYKRLLSPFEEAFAKAKAARAEDLRDWAAVEMQAGVRLAAIRKRDRDEKARQAAETQRLLDEAARAADAEKQQDELALLRDLKAEAATPAAKQEIQAVIDTIQAQPPVAVAAALVPQIVPQAQDRLTTMSERTDYSAVITDPAAFLAAFRAGHVPATFVLPAQVALNSEAGRRKLQDGAPLFPGVVSVSKTTFIRRPTGAR